MIGIIIASALTKVTSEEQKAGEKLFIAPKEECDPKELKKRYYI